MKFCNFCGSDLALRVPPGDNRPRYQCSKCGEIHYQNPKMVVGTIASDSQGRVLLCRRAIEPRHGFWTLPAGYMENGETMLQGAIRETWEEAEANVKSPALYQIFNVPRIHQVYFIYRASLDGTFGCGEESLECRLFHHDEIPWEELAFSTVYHCLKRWFEHPEDQQVMEQTIDYPARASS
jgi:ADP-ribose pyrophosphatase YjhB (NUDIX family)